MLLVIVNNAENRSPRDVIDTLIDGCWGWSCPYRGKSIYERPTVLVIVDAKENKHRCEMINILIDGCWTRICPERGKKKSYLRFIDVVREN